MDINIPIVMILHVQHELITDSYYNTSAALVNNNNNMIYCF